MKRFFLRMLNVVVPGRGEPDLAREVGSHLALLEDDFQRRGMTPEDARLAARRAFGGVEQAKELQRDARSFVWFDDARRDLQYSARLLRRNPIFALTAALSLAIGIGANTTIFTIANALLVARPAGVVEPDRLVDILGTQSGSAGKIGQTSYPNYLDVRERATTLDGVYAYQPVAQPMSLGSPSGAERISGTFVSTNYFNVLGAHPAVGRLFGGGDSEQPGASPIVVLSHSLWTRRFNSDPAIVGQTLTIGGEPFAVVGVAHQGFRGTTILVSDVWLPSAMGASPRLSSREMPWPLMGGRLKPGVSSAQAAAELDAIGRALEREYPNENRGRGLRAVAATPIPGNALPVAEFLSLLMAIVSLVLVTACVNVAGVLLARATARRREIAVRLAIGAGRARLVRQLLTETMLLFTLGGAAGLLVARAMTTALVSLLPALPIPEDVSLPLDGRALAYTAGLSMIAAVLSGLVPALQTSKADVVSALKDESSGPFGWLRLRSAFVVAQVTFSILLVVAAGLLMRALQRASAVDLGFDPRGVELTSLDLSMAGYTSATGLVFARELVTRVSELPDVQQAAVASTGEPIGDGRRPVLLTVPGVAGPSGQSLFDGNWNAVDSGYFSTMKIPFVAGRDFNAADRDGAALVAIIGEAAARRFWPGRPIEEAVGRSVTLQMSVRDVAASRGRIDQERRHPNPERTLQIVGVARDVKYFLPRDNAPHLFVYVPLAQVPFGTRVTIVARTTDGRRIAGEIRALIASMNPNLPVVTAQNARELDLPRVRAAARRGVGLGQPGPRGAADRRDRHLRCDGVRGHAANA
jgi:predicted permease